MAKIINLQPISEIVKGDGKYLEINSIFYTIQGEAIFAGKPAVFIRLAGCNLRCPMCDTEYTRSEKLHVEDILLRVTELRKDNGMLVVITGGEPFRQPLRKLTDLLLSCGYIVQIETNGTIYQNLDQRVSIVCSPKTGKINSKLLPSIDAFKYVIDYDSIDEKDGLPLAALEHPNSGTVYKAPAGKTIFIQPADTKNIYTSSLNLKRAVELTMKHNYRLCLQLHKIIGVE